MDKNAIWCVVLSTLVIVGSFLIYPMWANRNAVNEEIVVEETANVETPAENIITTEENDSIIAEVSENEAESEEVEVVPAVAEEIEFETEKVKVTFTTKGGDITSFKLKDHKDTDTDDAVQIADNIKSDIKNRAVSLALGPADTDIIDDIFICERDSSNPNVILFRREITKNGKKFKLGKRYTFDPNEYMFKLEILVQDAKDGLNFDGVAYTLRTSPQIGPHFNPKQNRYESRQFIAFDGKKAKKVPVGSGVFKPYEKTVLWGGIAGKYFEELVIPASTDILNKSYYSSKVEVDDYANAQAFFERRPITDKNSSDTYYMYFGPRNDKDLKIYNTPDTNAWKLSGHKLSESLQSSGWLSWLEYILKICLELLHKIIKNYGVCIIVLTILLKIVMFPLSKKQSMSTLKMQALQPQIQAVQKKYENDKNKQQIEMQKIYQEAGYNPASGCLPLIFQFLIIFAMYNLFNNYFEFRGSMFIPHWIEDLTTGDSVYSFKGNGIPLLGSDIRILPVVYVVTQILFSIFTQNGGASVGQNAGTMKFMTYGMPFLFFFLFYNAPSGLLIYWITSNVIQMFQQLIINQMMKNKKAEMSGAKVPAKKSSKRK